MSNLRFETLRGVSFSCSLDLLSAPEAPLTGGLTIRGKCISQDGHGFLSITDMWKLSGRSASKTPRYWVRLPTTKELVQALTVDVRFSHVIEHATEKSAIYSRKW